MAQDESPAGSAYAQRIVATLEPSLGKHTARRALGLVCKKTGRGADALAQTDQAAVADALRPMLRTLLGRDKTARLLAQLEL